jgi:type IV pilus assembly protein PilM
MAQVQVVDGEHRLTAAASADVPSHVRNNSAAKLAWFAETARDLLSQGGFKGNSAVLGLPASMLLIQHLRMPKLDEETLRKTLPFEARGKLPVDPGACLLRHIIAGDIFSDQEPKTEVILMAAAREFVNQFLDAASRARLDVTGMNVEPKAMIDCFAHVYRRKIDRETTSCFVDIGALATRAIIARGDEVLFARSIPFGGDHFTRAVAAAMSLTFEDAKLLRIQSAAQSPADERSEPRQVEKPPVEQSFALLGAASPPSEPVKPTHRDPRHVQVEQACGEPLTRLIEELSLCRRYHESTFPNRPVDRLIFIGGEARQRWLCQRIARQMQLAAQIGDPMVRMNRTTEVGIESGIDRRHPQPGWAVALGLTMGPAAAGEQAGSSRGRGLDNESGQSPSMAQRGAA